MNYISRVLENTEKIKQAVRLIKQGSETVISGVSDSQKYHMAHIISDFSDMKGLYIAWNEIQAKKAYADLNFRLC